MHLPESASPRKPTPRAAQAAAVPPLPVQRLQSISDPASPRPAVSPRGDRALTPVKVMSAEGSKSFDVGRVFREHYATRAELRSDSETIEMMRLVRARLNRVDVHGTRLEVRNALAHALTDMSREEFRAFTMISQKMLAIDSSKFDRSGVTLSLASALKSRTKDEDYLTACAASIHSAVEASSIAHLDPRSPGNRKAKHRSMPQLLSRADPADEKPLAEKKPPASARVYLPSANAPQRKSLAFKGMDGTVSLRHPWANAWYAVKNGVAKDGESRLDYESVVEKLVGGLPSLSNASVDQVRKRLEECAAALTPREFLLLSSDCYGLAAHLKRPTFASLDPAKVLPTVLDVVIRLGSDRAVAMRGEEPYAKSERFLRDLKFLVAAAQASNETFPAVVGGASSGSVAAESDAAVKAKSTPRVGVESKADAKADAKTVEEPVRPRPGGMVRSLTFDPATMNVNASTSSSEVDAKDSQVARPAVDSGAPPERKSVLPRERGQARRPVTAYVDRQAHALLYVGDVLASLLGEKDQRSISLAIAQILRLLKQQDPSRLRDRSQAMQVLKEAIEKAGLTPQEKKAFTRATRVLDLESLGSGRGRKALVRLIQHVSDLQG